MVDVKDDNQDQKEDTATLDHGTKKRVVIKARNEDEHLLWISNNLKYIKLYEYGYIVYSY